MQPKTLKRLVAALAILGAAWGIVLLVQRREPKTKLLWEKAKAAKSLVIAGPAGKIVLKKEGPDWNLVEPIKYKADRAKMDGLLGKLAGAPVSDSMSSDASRHAYFMVTASSAVRVQGFVDGTNPAFDAYFGKAGSDYDSVLFRYPDGSDVYEAKGVSRYELEAAPGQWADKNVVKIDALLIRSIEIGGGKEAVRLKKDAKGWHLNGSSAALSTATVSTTVDPIVSKLGGLEAEEVIAAATASSTTARGLAHPELKIAVRYLDAGASKSGKETETVLELAVAPKEPDGRNALRKIGSPDVIYKASTWQLDPFRKKLSDFQPKKTSGGS